jgi:hypothetical protein
MKRKIKKLIGWIFGRPIVIAVEASTYQQSWGDIKYVVNAYEHDGFTLVGVTKEGVNSIFWFRKYHIGRYKEESQELVVSRWLKEFKPSWIKDNRETVYT